MSQNWSDSKTFQRETARTIVLAVTGTIMVLIVMKPIEAYIDYNTELDKQRMLISFGIIDEFMKEAHTYKSVAHDYCAEIPISEDHLKNVLYDKFRSTQRRLTFFFKDAEGVVRASNKLDATIRLFLKLCEKRKTAKPEWEPARQEMINASNDLADAAMKTLDERKLHWYWWKN